MNRRGFLIAAAAIALTPPPAAARALSLAEISSYLNGIRTARASFTQINADGTISTGTLMIERPGRIRFEYDPPELALVLAWQGQVAVFDAKSDEPPARFPLSRTPLKLILGPDIDLTRERMVVGLSSDGTTTTVIAQDPKRPEYGRLHLVFTSDPIELRQWIVEDEAGQKTTVILGALQTGLRFPIRLFDIEREMRARGL